MRGCASFSRDTTPWGRIAPGHRADLLVLGTDPLADLGALHDVRGVLVAGSWRPADAAASQLPMITASHALAFLRANSIAACDASSSEPS
jgi:hypothetical protein